MSLLPRTDRGAVDETATRPAKAFRLNKKAVLPLACMGGLGILVFVAVRPGTAPSVDTKLGDTTKVAAVDPGPGYPPPDVPMPATPVVAAMPPASTLPMPEDSRSWGLPKMGTDKPPPEPPNPIRSSLRSYLPADREAGGKGGEKQHQQPPGEQEHSEASAGLSESFRPSETPRSQPVMMQDPALTIPQGTSISCITDAISSRHPGLVRCMVDEDVFGATGTVRLVERFSHVVGEVRGGAQQGDSSLNILWRTIITRDYAEVPVESLGTDDLGRPGVPGNVNNKWGARIGNALLFTLLDGGFQVGASLAGNTSRSGTVIQSFGSNGQSLASQAFQNGAGIKPEIDIPQGTPIRMTVSHDLHFSSIYALRLAGDR